MPDSHDGAPVGLCVVCKGAHRYPSISSDETCAYSGWHYWCYNAAPGHTNENKACDVNIRDNGEDWHCGCPCHYVVTDDEIRLTREGLSNLVKSLYQKEQV